MMVRPHLRFPLTTTGFSTRSLFGLVLLILLAYLGNYFHWTLFFNIDFLFGSIAVWLVVWLYGAAWGTVAGVIAATCTYLLWNHPYAIATFSLEALFVGILFHRRQHSIVLLDAVFWLLIGMPWIGLAYPVLLHIDPTQTQFILLKQSVNGLFNALVASQILTYLPVYRWCDRPPAINQFPLQQALFNLLVAFVFFPTLVLILLASHRVVDDIKLDARSDLNTTSKYLATEVQTWYQQQLQPVNRLVELIETNHLDVLQKQMIIDSQALFNFQFFYVIKPDGTVSQAIANPVVRANINSSSTVLQPGKRAFFQRLSQTLQPTLPDILVERWPGTSPVIVLSVPLKVDGERRWLLGLINLSPLELLLRSKLDEPELQVTLVDRQKAVIASTQLERVGMRNFDRRQTGEVHSLDATTYHWLPTVDTPLVMARWTKSVFVQETLLDRTTGWTLIVETPARSRVDYIQKVYSQNLALLLLVAGLALALANLLSRYFVKPLIQLAVITTNLPNKLLEREGIVWSHSPITEIALLTRNFRSMATSLKQKFGEIQQVNETLEQRVQERTQALLQANAELEAEIAERQRIEAALRQSEEQLQLALEASRMGIWDWNLCTNHVIWSPRNEQLLGIAPGGFDGTYEMFESFVHPDDRAAIVQAATQAVQSQQEFYQEFRVVCADGSIHWMEGRGRIFCNQAGEAVRMIGTMVDITDRKQAEEKLRCSEVRYRRIVETANEGIWIIDADNRTNFVNPKMAAMLGYSIAEMTGKSMLEFMDADSITIAMQQIERRRQGIAEQHDFKFQHKHGFDVWTVVSTNPIFDDAGQYIGALGMIIDISDRKATEIALRQSEAQNSALLHAIPDLMIRIRGDGTIVEFRPPTGFKTYASRDDCGKKVYDVLPPDVAQERMYYVEQALQTGTTQIYEFHLSIDGETYTYEARVVVSGEDETLAIVRDISARKQAELALQESRDLFSATFNQSTDGIFLVDDTTLQILDCNQRGIELFEFDRKEDLIGRRGDTFHKHPWTPEEMAAIIQEFNQKGVWNSEIEYLTNKGNTFWGSISVKLFSIANNPLNLIRITDTSERRRAEAALQMSEAHNQALLNAIPDLMIRMTREGIYLDFRPAKDFKTYKPYENMRGRSIYDVIPDELAQERMRYVERALHTGETQIYEFQILVDGKIYHEEARIVVSGEDEVLVIVRDMTEHKHTEAAIRSRNQELLTLHTISETILSSQSLREAFHAIAAEIGDAIGFPCIAIELYDAARQVMVFEGVKGIPLPPNCDVLEVPIDHTLSGMVATTGQAMVKNFASQELKQCAANETLNQLPVKTFICMPMMVNQKTIGTLSLAHPEEIQPEDNFLRWVSSLANYLALITDRKQAEVSLRESEERLKLALEATQMGIWELNLLDNRSTWAESCELVYGLSPGSFEATSEAFLQRVHPEDRELVEHNVAQAIDENIGLNHEFRIIHPDGSIHWVLERGRVFCDEVGQPIRLLGIAMNITDRKQFEAFLQQTNAKLGIQVAERTTELKEAIAQLHTEIIKRQQTQEELRRTLATNQALLSAIPDLILRVKRDGTYLDCIPTKEIRTVFPPEHQIGKNLQEILPINLAQQRLGYIEQAFQTGLTQVYEYQFLIDGSVRDEEARIVVSGDDEVVVLIRDITDRKQAERALQAAHEQLTGWVGDLEQRHQEITLLNQMSDLLQTCLTQEESYTVLTQLLPCLFPNSSGAVFLISDSQNPVEAITTWGTLTSQTLFVAHECFALRRGQPHFVENTGKGLCCHHLLRPLPSTYCCVPMVARGKAIGVLYFSPLTTGLILPAQRQLAITVAQQIALALANLKLYETLQNQSIRDPLTGLFNRRYLEESLTRELYRAQRSHQPLSIIVIDVDHFKRFNDTFGHDAGDAVLQELGSFLQSKVRGSDVACRFGGEEMVLILPGASLVDARQRAEQLRQGVKQIKIKHHQALGAITISLGVACYPEHAEAKESLIKAADAALYRAKAEGRDRVATADPET